MNEILQCIQMRRTIRHYEKRQISDDDLSLILEAATWSPSGSNNQAWHFLVIQNENILKELNTLVRQEFATWEPDDDYPAKLSAKKNSQNPDYCFYHQAPTLIVVSNKTGYTNAMQDSSIAQQTTFLAAHSLGLGTCWINQLYWLRDCPDLKAYLTKIGVPEEYMVCASLVVGHIATMPPAPPRKGMLATIIK